MTSLNGTRQPENQKIPGCIRKMSRCERLFFMSPACTVMMAARITGMIDETRFRQALGTLQKKHPLLSAKIVFDDRHEAWFSSDGVPAIPLRIISRTADGQWLDELKDTARVPFEITRGPLIKCVLLHSPDTSDFLIFCNHSICDGMATAHFVRDLVSLYADPEQAVIVTEPPDVLDLNKPGLTLQGIFMRLFARFTNWKWRKNPYYFGPEDYGALYSGYWEKRRPGLVMAEFDPEESARLLASCREHGVTIGSAVSAACLQAYTDINGGFPPSRQTLVVPFDLRKRTTPPIGEPFCFCDGGVRFPFACSKNKQFWENARDLHKEIHSRIENLDPACLDLPDFDPSLSDAFSAFGPFAPRIPEVFDRTETMQRFHRDTKNVVLSLNANLEKSFPGFLPSNLGRIDIPDKPGGIRVDRMVFLPSASELNPLIMGGVGTNGGIVFTLPFVDPPAKTSISPEPEMIRIRNRVLELLGFPEKVHPGATE